MIKKYIMGFLALIILSLFPIVSGSGICDGSNDFMCNDWGNAGDCELNDWHGGCAWDMGGECEGSLDCSSIGESEQCIDCGCNWNSEYPGHCEGDSSCNGERCGSPYSCPGCELTPSVCYDDPGANCPAISIDYCDSESGCFWDYCVYTGIGGWEINCSKNCVINTQYELFGNNIHFVGNGTATFLSNIIGWNQIIIEDGCKVSIQSLFSSG